MKSRNDEKTALPGITAAAATGLSEFLLTFLFYRQARGGAAISAQFASGRPGAFLLQCLKFGFWLPAVLLILFALALKKRFCSEFYFTLRGRWQRSAAVFLAVMILGLTVYGLIVKPDKAAVLLSLFYYLVIVAFAEEFIVHDACTFFLRNTSWPLRYLLPNFFFALPHLFAYAGWGEIGSGVLLRFLLCGLPGYVSGGCMFQLLKEKSGTIWLPVLLHCLLDYSIILNY